MMGQNHKQEVFFSTFRLSFFGLAPHFAPDLSFYTCSPPHINLVVGFQYDSWSLLFYSHSVHLKSHETMASYSIPNQHPQKEVPHPCPFPAGTQLHTICKQSAWTQLQAKILLP